MAPRTMLASGLLLAASAVAAQAPDETTIEVHAYAFRPTYSRDLLVDNGNGYRYMGAKPVSRWLAAPLALPSGVLIDRVVLSSCSEHAGDLLLTLFDNGVGGGGSGGGTPVASVTSVGGCGMASAWPPAPGYLYERNDRHPLYLVLYWAGDSFDGSTRFNSIQVDYHRTVSPNPSTSHFQDVPVAHPFHRYVEALWDAGITGGCNPSPPLFCPDEPLTRGQMAVYLSVALGLHWLF